MVTLPCHNCICLVNCISNLYNNMPVKKDLFVDPYNKEKEENEIEVEGLLMLISFLINKCSILKDYLYDKSSTKKNIVINNNLPDLNIYILIHGYDIVKYNKLSFNTYIHLVGTNIARVHIEIEEELIEEIVNLFFKSFLQLYKKNIKEEKVGSYSGSVPQYFKKTYELYGLVFIRTFENYKHLEIYNLSTNKYYNSLSEYSKTFKPPKEIKIKDMIWRTTNAS